MITKGGKPNSICITMLEYLGDFGFTVGVEHVRHRSVEKHGTFDFWLFEFVQFG